MNTYSLIALVIRIILALVLFKIGKKAFKPHSRNPETLFALLMAITMLVGFYIYFTSLLLLLYFGYSSWLQLRRRGKFWRWILLLLLTCIIFLKGPGVLSVTHF